MYGGIIAEEAEAGRLYAKPRHPYTQALLGSFPDLAHPERKLVAIAGTPPRLDAMPPGSPPFAPRCPMVFDRCLVERPPAYELIHGRKVACFWSSGGEECGAVADAEPWTVEGLRRSSASDCYDANVVACR